MELEKLTKQELLNKLKEQEHLVSAVEFKDSQINKLTKELELSKKESEESKSKLIKESEESKSKLIKESEELRNKLKEQEHLAKAIEVKDKEIEKLKTSIDVHNKDYDSEKQKHNQERALEISNIKKSKEEEIINLQLQIQELTAKAEKLDEAEKIFEIAKHIESENKELFKTANLYLGAFRNLMKMIQGGLDNAIEYEALITESVQTKNKIQGGNK